MRVETAREMLQPVEAALPADIAVFAAAVADWRVAEAGEQKIKKTAAACRRCSWSKIPTSWRRSRIAGDERPPLVIGFAAETEHLIDNAKAKLARKGCDWIVANDVSPATGVMGGDRNTVHLLTRDGDGDSAGTPSKSWPVMTKEQVAAALVARIADAPGKAS